MTDKQELFIREYLIDFNSTKAAIRAGYSARTAYSIGNELLKKPEISQAINQAMNERKEPPRFEPYICKIFLFGVWLLRTFKSIRQIKNSSLLCLVRASMSGIRPCQSVKRVHS